MTLAELCAGRAPAPCLPVRPVPSETGYWARLPASSRWSFLCEEADGSLRYAAGCFGLTLCRGSAPSRRKAERALEQGKEQAAIALLRRLRAKGDQP